MPGRSIFRSLSHSNFRLFLVGQSFSLIGTWAQTTAMPWLLSRLVESKSVYGAVGFFAQLPALLVPPLAGVVADRMDRRNLLLVTQSMAMTQAFALAALVGTGQVQVWQVLLLNMVLSAVNAFDMPARQTFLGDLIDDRDDLANAIALNSSMVNGARLFGPALAAVLILAFGEAGCFFANGVSFLAVLAALWAMRLPPRKLVRPHEPFWQGFRDGLRYVATHRPIRAALLTVAAVSLFGLPYNLLLPFLTRETLAAGEVAYGMLVTAPGVGALSAALFIAWLGLDGLLDRIAIAPVLAGLCLLAVSYCTTLVPAVLLLFGVGFGMLMVLNSANILLQTLAEDDKRGRVLGFLTIAFTGMAPLGNLLVPSLADWLGVGGALRVSAAVCVAAGVAFAASARAWHDEVRSALAGPTPAIPEPVPDREVTAAPRAV